MQNNLRYFAIELARYVPISVFMLQMDANDSK